MPCVKSIGHFHMVRVFKMLYIKQLLKDHLSLRELGMEKKVKCQTVCHCGSRLRNLSHKSVSRQL